MMGLREETTSGHRPTCWWIGGFHSRRHYFGGGEAVGTRWSIVR